MCVYLLVPLQEGFIQSLLVVLGSKIFLWLLEGLSVDGGCLLCLYMIMPKHSKHYLKRLLRLHDHQKYSII